MTKAEKRMKKYISAVKRRLSLPREIRERVMSDFMSAIEARREAGQTDEEILAELGTPKEAAAVLNEQMKEFAYRKSPWRFLFLTIGILSGGMLALERFVLAFTSEIVGVISFPANGGGSVGIIGGADGPTAIFLTAHTSGPNWEKLLLLALCLIGFAGYWRLCRCKQK